MLQILLLDNYDSFTFNIVQIINELQIGKLSLFANDQIDLEEVKKYDKILLSPGAGIPSEAGIMNTLINAYAAQKSILGICLGHQAIAETQGAQLLNLPKVYHGQKVKITLSQPQDYLFAQLPPEIEVGLYHSWAVKPETLPKTLQPTAYSTIDNILMAIAHQHYDLRGVQFHPESYMTSQGTQIIKNWLKY
ncbi:MAG: aminodeoxychorismate/anthranilate synthase component II [Cytophagales bacterium]|nr:MAG: aminodeoxychorismate/anthranilate synthase component II [Cytophagales bacterium]